MYSVLTVRKLLRYKFPPASPWALTSFLGMQQHSYQRRAVIISNLQLCQNFSSTATMNNKIKVIKPPSEEKELSSLGYVERNMLKGRALSPHLTIYAPQLTSMMSISTRFSGVALTIWTWSFGIGYMLFSHDIDHYVTMLESAQLSSCVLALVKCFFVFPAAFHVLNGVRHLAWGYGYLLSLKQIYLSGYVVLVLTPLLTAWLASL